jgi:hypothetical protein
MAQQDFAKLSTPNWCLVWADFIKVAGTLLSNLGPNHLAIERPD